MGKKSAIESLSRIVSNVVVHRILINYTNKPESINYLNNEAKEYRDAAISRTKKFNWNQSDKQEIKSNALEIFKNRMARTYGDVKFPISEAERFLDEVMKEIGLV